MCRPPRSCSTTACCLIGTVRATKANQTGILGYGGDKNDDYRLEYEGTATLPLSRQWVTGIEYRTKPDNLSFAKEQDWYDVFVAYFLNKNLSVTVAYADLGDVALQSGQRGLYLSVQAGF